MVFCDCSGEVEGGDSGVGVEGGVKEEERRRYERSVEN